ncbi:MAG: hypothetical protein RIC80_14390 [Cyclobacteriaceae bacterium]
MALTLFKDRYTQSFEAYGFYTYHDFYEFGQQIGIRESRVRRIINEFKKTSELLNILIERSFLKEELKAVYNELYADKLKRLMMIQS